MFELVNSVVDFCSNPFTYKMQNKYEKALFGSKIDAILGVENIPDMSGSLQEMSIESLCGLDHYVLYSGGKESLLTCKILDYFGIAYKKVTFRESVKNLPEHVTNDADIVIGSEIIEEYGDDKYGRHIPLIAYYCGVLSESYPHSVIWVGAANVNDNVRYGLGNSDHSDFAFDYYYKINSSLVYSCVNSLTEFDIYRIAKKHFNYDIAASTTDNPDKLGRMVAFDQADELYKTLSAIPRLERSMMFSKEFNSYEYISLHRPAIFDFRSDIRLFLAALDSGVYAN